MEFTEVVKNRFSCKKYDGRPVEPEKLNAILEAGRVAPTAKNLQEQRIYVVQSPEALAKVDGVTPCRYGAPTVLVVAFDSKNVFTHHQMSQEGAKSTPLRIPDIPIFPNACA